jgi:hypothetical protein
VYPSGWNRRNEGEIDPKDQAHNRSNHMQVHHILDLKSDFLDGVLHHTYIRNISGTERYIIEPTSSIACQLAAADVKPVMGRQMLWLRHGPY